MKKLLCLMAVLVLLVPVAAATEILDPEAPGSITFTLDFDGQPLDGGSLAVYQVARVVISTHDPHFELLEIFRDNGPDIRDLHNPELPGRFAELVSQAELTPITAPIESGRALFSGLMPGLYLVTQQEQTPGFSPLQPFLVSVPQWDGDAYVYDLVLKPKVALEQAPTEPSEPTQPTEPPDPDLPQTGQLNWPIPLLSVAGFGLFVLGFYLCFGKKHGHET